MRWITVLAMGMTMMGGAAAQSLPAPPSAPILTNQVSQQDSTTMLMEHGKRLLAKAAASADGSANEILNQYDGYYTMLVARVKSGIVEVHTSYDDFFFIVDGELTETVGGKAEVKPTTPGELRAPSMTGGKPYVLRKGDVMHIQAKIPHQTTLATGETVIYYMVKVGVRK